MAKPTEERIPFEPGNRAKKKKEEKKPPVSAAPERQATSPSVPQAQNASNTKGKTQNTSKKDSLGIPQEVNKRIARRVALFCGIPTFLGIAIFIVSYIVVIKHWADLPNVAVVLLSMLFFGLGVLGLSYGALSASWEENRVGTWWGGEEFRRNFGYLKEAWKQQRAEKKLATEQNEKSK
ncbi:PAM68 family protein [Tumidithrix elongata RA019]|uniref:PAM68 family protein n=1 Tax=Tumidithrix elongata BACA0141 TaxID=2716417 RepID=A0AAW9PWH8_9CYAN|nr:PAM68 family protein [Tumidithrix elongata RA019]